LNQPYDLSPGDRADDSVRKILYLLFGALRSNVDGVIVDADIEFLHDFRVANRRTRTALSQTKGVVPPMVMDAFLPEFKWLGDVTGPCRDLDVMLLKMDGYQHPSKTDDGALGSLEVFMREKRQVEHGLVRAALQSERLQRLFEGWHQFLDTGGEEEIWPPLASSPIIELAAPQIFKAYRRTRKRGTGVGAEAPAALLHRLRIDSKKLRYLLEFFSDLFPGTTVPQLIRELKQLQDILGGYNDTAVQLTLIRDFAKQNTASAETLIAVDHLTELITNRQRKLRSKFGERFELFASDESRKLYKKTFKTR